MHPDATATETWCAESASAIATGETLIHHLNELFIHSFLLWLLHLCQLMSCFKTRGSTEVFFSLHAFRPSPLGWVHTVTALTMLYLRTLTSVKLQAWPSLVPATETACPVGPVCATTPRSLKGPTVSTTRPSVKDSEASSVTVRQFVILESVLLAACVCVCRHRHFLHFHIKL